MSGGGPPPLRPAEERSAWLLLRLETELRQRIERIRSGLADPGLARTVEGLARPDGVRRELDELSAAIEEALRALGAMRGHLTHPDEGTRVEGRRPEARADDTPAGLPEVLEEHLRDRAKAPGFEHEVVHDAVRGWVVRWKERNPDGGVYASGRLYQRPWEWMKTRGQAG